MTPSPALVAWLSLIGYAEGTSTEDITANNGYDVIVTGEVEDSNMRLLRHEEVFTDYSQHPFASGRPAIEVVAPGARFPNGLYSTASGRYQFILPTWRGLAAKLGLTDFSPASQDAACIDLLRQHGVTGMVLAGNIQEAIMACAPIWASFPGGPYGQGGKTVGDLLDKYQSFLTPLV